MPKRRSTTAAYGGGGGGTARSAGGGSGGGSGAGRGVVVAGSNALDVSPEPVVVPNVRSNSRNRLENVVISFTGPNTALAHSESGRPYNVSFERGRYSCECGDWRFHHHRDPNYPCRHVQAALYAAGRMDEIPPEVAMVPLALPTPQRLEDMSATEHRDVTREVWSEATAAYEQAAAAAEPPQPEAPALDDAAFAELWQQAQNPPEYQYSDVLPNPSMTFGLEIEFEGGNIQAIADELYEEGLIAAPRRSDYHSGRHNPNLWAFERDGSVPTGGELVSPVFRDTPTAWQQVEKVCEIIRRHGGRATARCGGHIHVGTAEPLDSRNERWNRLLRLVRANEDLLFRLAAGGESGGRHRGTDYVVPIANRETLVGTGHYHAVNKRRDTVEFRYFNGTLDPRQIQANVRVAAGIVDAAARDELDRRIPDRVLARGTQARRQIINGEQENHGIVREFLDTVFTRVRDKVAVLWLYATSRWQTA
ncbi:MAG: amidoligase family protein [Moorellaceae bacterium]